MRKALVAVALAACSRGPSGPTQGVTALAGNIVAESGATILSHRADGTILDDQVADATGHAAVQTEPGSYVTAVFPALIAPLPTAIAMVTAPSPNDDSDIVLHGPPDAQIQVVVAGLTVDGPGVAGALDYTIDLGCNTQTSSTFPAVVDVIAPCEGTDTNLDILARAYDGTETLLGYAAAREPIGMDQAGDAIAEFTVGAWQTTGTMVPVTQTGVTADVSLTLISDTLAFDTPAIANGEALVWDGLVVDSSIATASMTGQTATQYAPGTPAAIAVSAADFMGSLAAPALTLDVTLDATWPAITLTGPDALDLHLMWTANGETITWDAVMTPDTTGIAFPQLDPTTQTVLALPVDPSAFTGQLAALDSSDLADFTDLQAAGVYANTTIVPTPTSGEIRASTATVAP
ncbi:MAG TPA: hypothetical protein VH143_02075 [Kofleriaceae bacterium]|nr:hypothetical protein [Kofleriaceae bacterium]